MDVISLGNQVVRQKGPIAIVDLNKDGRKDLIFGTMLVGDPLHMQDKLKWMVTSDIDTNLPVNTLEQSLVMSKGDLVPLDDFNGYHWCNASGTMLAQKITGTTGPVFWEGNRKNANALYLPVQVLKNGQRFNGWVQWSMDMANESVVLHLAAISKVAERVIHIPSLKSYHHIRCIAVRGYPNQHLLYNFLLNFNKIYETCKVCPSWCCRMVTLL